MACASDLLNIDEVSDIQRRLEALEETQKECIQLLTEELEENKSIVEHLRASYIVVDWYALKTTELYK